MELLFFFAAVLSLLAALANLAAPVANFLAECPGERPQGLVIIHVSVHNSAMSEIEGFETAAQAATRFGVEDSQVRRLAAEDRIPGAVKVAGVWLVPTDSWPEEAREGGPGRPPQWAKSGTDVAANQDEGA